MKQFYLLTLFVLCFFYDHPVQAQRNDMWPAGYHIGLDFSGGGSGPTVISDNAVDASFSSSVSDLCGQLLFYSDGRNAFDRLHRRLPNGNALGTVSQPGMSAAIASVPGSDSQYYLFVSSVAGVSHTGNGITYSVVDMRLNGGYGDIPLSSKNLFIDSLKSACIAIAGSCGNQWLICHDMDSAIFYAYNISASGPGLPVVSRVGKIFTPHHFLFTQFKVSPDFTKIVLSGTSLSDFSYTRVGDNISLFDFDVITGKVSNYQVIDTAIKLNGGYCADFSPDGTKLYAGLGAGPGYLVQYDLAAGTLPAIKASATNIARLEYGPVTDIRRGPDNMLYQVNNDFKSGTWMRFSRVPFPDRSGARCGYEPSVASFGPGYMHTLSYLGNYFVEHLYGSDTLYQCSTKKLCKGSYVTVRSSLPNGHYTWYDGDTVYEKKLYDTGMFWVWSTSACGTIYESIHVVPGTPDTSFGVGLDTTVCIALPITLNTIRVWDHYTWSTGDTGLSTTATAPDTLLLTATHQCHVLIDSFYIKIKPADTTHELLLDTAICEGTFIVRIPPAGRTMLRWSDGDTSVVRKIFAPDTLSMYTYKDCTVYADTVRVHAIKNIYHTSRSDTFFCAGTALKLEGQPTADSFLWNTGSNKRSILVMKAAAYWVNSIKHCAHYSDTFHVRERPYDIQVEHIDSICCQLDSATITAADGYDRYLWSSGSTSKSVVVRGPGLVAVRVTATDTTACKIRNQLYELNFIDFTGHIQDTVICNNTDTILLDASIGMDARYQWNTGDTTAAIKVHTPNTYLVYVDAAGCILTDTIQVLYQPLYLTVGGDTSICKGQTLILRSSISDAQYRWSTGATDSSIIIDKGGHYSLHISKDGCESTAATDVSFVNCDRCVTFPNAFSPNNDGINDFFKPLLNCPPDTYELSIYNRWGQQVWHTHNPVDTWNGTFNGVPSDGNTYFYMLRVSFTGQQKAAELFKGEVILVR